jgi:hypothetical protein
MFYEPSLISSFFFALHVMCLWVHDHLHVPFYMHVSVCTCAPSSSACLYLWLRIPAPSKYEVDSSTSHIFFASAPLLQ